MIRSARSTTPIDLSPTMTVEELAIARSVLYASLFDYPVTLAQLRQTLIESAQTPTEILAAYDRSAALRNAIDFEDGFFFPHGRDELLAERRWREARSRAFLRRHRTLLRLVCAMPYVSMVALSGSIAHLNLEGGGDLDLFIVTKGQHVWSVTVAVVVLAKLMRRRRILCANFVLADTALCLEQQDLFTASQIIHLKPLIGQPTYRRFLDANPFIRRFYPNFHAAQGGNLPFRRIAPFEALKSGVETLLRPFAAVAEVVCRRMYRAYLMRRADTWQSPDNVRLQPECLKLHTQSHRSSVLERFDSAVRRVLDART
jgi:hypothetical protein